MTVATPTGPLKGPAQGGRRQAALAILGMTVIAVLVLVVSATLGSRGSGYVEPSEDELAGLVEVELVSSSAKQDVVSGLQRPGDDRHPPALIDPDDLRSGGPPPDGIPPLDQPRFQRAGDVDWLEPNEAVLLLEADVGAEASTARIYPVQVVTWHEIVNDTVEGRPITVSFCPLCNSAVAFDRTLADGRVLDFGTSGLLLNSSLVMYDRQTETLWTHFDGRAVLGHLTGERLSLLPVTTVSWADAAAAHPDALVLSRVTGFERAYGNNPYPGYDDASERPSLFEGPIDDRLRAKERVAVARFADESVTVGWERLAEAGVFVTDLDGRGVVFSHRPGTASSLDDRRVSAGRDVGAVAVYWLPAGAVNATPLGAGAFRLDTGAEFSFLGESRAGEEVLDPVEHLDTFWFAIAAFDPDTRIAWA